MSTHYASATVRGLRNEQIISRLFIVPHAATPLKGNMVDYEMMTQATVKLQLIHVGLHQGAGDVSLQWGSGLVRKVRKRC